MVMEAVRDAEEAEKARAPIGLAMELRACLANIVQLGWMLAIWVFNATMAIRQRTVRQDLEMI
jgi:hypothetical protein